MAPMKRIHTHHGEVVPDMVGDMSQEAWGEHDLRSL